MGLQIGLISGPHKLQREGDQIRQKAAAVVGEGGRDLCCCLAAAAALSCPTVAGEGEPLVSFASPEPEWKQTTEGAVWVLVR